MLFDTRGVLGVWGVGQRTRFSEGWWTRGKPDRVTKFSVRVSWWPALMRSFGVLWRLYGTKLPCELQPKELAGKSVWQYSFYLVHGQVGDSCRLVSVVSSRRHLFEKTNLSLTDTKTAFSSNGLNGLLVCTPLLQGFLCHLSTLLKQVLKKCGKRRQSWVSNSKQIAG